jgi:hypothetical protein
MDRRIVFAKTRRGKHELATRSFGLRQRLRTVLILVDGTSTVANLQRKCAGLGDIAPTLKSLAEGGYIRPTVSGLDLTLPLTPLKAALIKQAVLTLGMVATEGLRAMQQAPDTKAGLIRAIDETARLAHDSRSEEVILTFRDACHHILARETVSPRLAEPENHDPLVRQVDDLVLYTSEQQRDGGR